MRASEKKLSAHCGHKTPYLPLIYSVLRFVVVLFQTNLCVLNLKDFKNGGSDFQLKDEEKA